MFIAQEGFVHVALLLKRSVTGGSLTCNRRPTPLIAIYAPVGFHEPSL